jgi:hypothetical protein
MEGCAMKSGMVLRIALSAEEVAASVKPTRRVTAEQLKEGYAEWTDGVIHNRPYVIVKRLSDGTYLVLESPPPKKVEP